MALNINGRMKAKTLRTDKCNEQEEVTVEDDSSDTSINKVGLLCLDWNNDELTQVTREPPKLFVFGFFVDETDYDEFPDEEASYSLKAYILTGDNGCGFYGGWLVHGYFFTESVDLMENGQFPEEMLEDKYPEEMKKLDELLSKYAALPESVGGGFPEGCMLSEDDIDDPAEQSYLINSIDELDRLVAQYLDKVGDIDLDEMPEETFNVNFPFMED